MTARSRQPARKTHIPLGVGKYNMPGSTRTERCSQLTSAIEHNGNVNAAQHPGGNVAGPIGRIFSGVILEKERVAAAVTAGEQIAEFCETGVGTRTAGMDHHDE